MATSSCRRFCSSPVNNNNTSHCVLLPEVSITVFSLRSVMFKLWFEICYSVISFHVWHSEKRGLLVILQRVKYQTTNSRYTTQCIHNPVFLLLDHLSFVWIDFFVLFISCLNLPYGVKCVPYGRLCFWSPQVSHNPIYENVSAHYSRMPVNTHQPAHLYSNEGELDSNQGDLYCNEGKVYPNQAELYSNTADLYSNIQYWVTAF